MRLIAVGSMTVVGLLVVGCHSRQVGLDPATALARPADAVRVTLVDGSALIVRHPVIRGDSLVGRTAGGDSLPIAIPLPRVRTVERLELGADTMAVFWIGTSVFAAFLLVTGLRALVGR
jgi:hypothetical protein